MICRSWRLLGRVTLSTRLWLRSDLAECQGLQTAWQGHSFQAPGFNSLRNVKVKTACQGHSFQALRLNGDNKSQGLEGLTCQGHILPGSLDAPGSSCFKDCLAWSHSCQQIIKRSLPNVKVIQSLLGRSHFSKWSSELYPLVKPTVQRSRSEDELPWPVVTWDFQVWPGISSPEPAKEWQVIWRLLGRVNSFNMALHRVHLAECQGLTTIWQGQILNQSTR